MRKRLLLLLAGLIFLGGVGLLLYPTVSQWWNARSQSDVIANYADEIADLSEEEIEKEIGRAREYNLNLTEAVAMADPFREQDVVDTSDYDTLLNHTADGVMGYVEIPKINVLLPIYHGVDSSILNMGAGHLPETSLPVGGPGTHCVLAGHSGMPHARLFTDLPELNQGDTFLIHVYNRTLTYTVDQVKTVLPTDTSDLNVIPGEDHVTLLTCVPIGVNSHRLLVRGTRTDDFTSFRRTIRQRPDSGRYILPANPASPGFYISGR